MKIDLRKVAEQSIDLAKRKGADEADVIVLQSRSFSVSVREGDLENVENNDQITLGLRVLVGKKQACVAGSDFRTSAIADIAERAIAMAGVAPEDPFLGLAKPSQLGPPNETTELRLYSEEGFPSPEECTRLAQTMEEAAYGVQGVSKTDSSSAGYGESRYCFLASNGFESESRKNFLSAGCSAIAGEGLEMETDYYGETRIFQLDMSTPERIGRKAGKRAAAKLGSIKPSTMNTAVLFDRRVSATLIGHILGAINGGAIARGTSWLKDDLGNEILSTNLDLYEEPFRPKSLSSTLYDGEGIAKQERKFIEKGVLKSWVMDLATSRKLGMPTTGNATRGVASPPSPGTTNIALTCGDKSPGEMMKEIDSGILITSLIGSTINSNTGDYSRGASGFLIENGEVTQPISEFTIAGNLRDMIKTLIPSNDPREFSSYKVPSLLIENMTVAGS